MKNQVKELALEVISRLTESLNKPVMTERFIEDNVERVVIDKTMVNHRVDWGLHLSVLKEVRLSISPYVA